MAITAIVHAPIPPLDRAWLGYTRRSRSRKRDRQLFCCNSSNLLLICLISLYSSKSIVNKKIS